MLRTVPGRNVLGVFTVCGLKPTATIVASLRDEPKRQRAANGIRSQD